MQLTRYFPPHAEVGLLVRHSPGALPMHFRLRLTPCMWAHSQTVPLRTSHIRNVCQLGGCKAQRCWCKLTSLLTGPSSACECSPAIVGPIGWLELHHYKGCWGKASQPVQPSNWVLVHTDRNCYVSLNARVHICLIIEYFGSLNELHFNLKPFQLKAGLPRGGAINRWDLNLDLFVHHQMPIPLGHKSLTKSWLHSQLYLAACSTNLGDLGMRLEC